MRREARTRTTALAAAVVALLASLPLFYGAVGHGLQGGPHGEGGMVEHGIAGLCLVLVTALASLLVSAPPSEPRLQASGPESGPARLPPPEASEASARASPAWLQRFLN